MPGYEEFGSTEDALDTFRINLPLDVALDLDDIQNQAAIQHEMRIRSSPRARATDWATGHMLSFTFELDEDGVWDPSKNKPNPEFPKAIEARMTADYLQWCHDVIEVGIKPALKEAEGFEDGEYIFASRGDNEGRAIVAVKEGSLVSAEIVATEGKPSIFVIFQPTEFDEFDIPHILIEEPSLLDNGELKAQEQAFDIRWGDSKLVYSSDILYEEEVYRQQVEECLGLSRGLN